MLDAALAQAGPAALVGQRHAFGDVGGNIHGQLDGAGLCRQPHDLSLRKISPRHVLGVEMHLGGAELGGDFRVIAIA